MYYVGETYWGFDRNTCFFDTFEEARVEFETIFMELIDDVSRRVNIMRDSVHKYDVERWIIKNMITNEVVAERTFVLYDNGKFYISQ